MTLKIVNFMSAYLSMIPLPFLSSFHHPPLCLRCFAVRSGGEDRHHAVRRCHLQQYRLHGEGGLQQPGARQPAHPLRHHSDTAVQQLPRAGGGQTRSPLEGFAPSPTGNGKPGLLAHRQTPWQRYEPRLEQSWVFLE